jgi:hypothetical protein
LSQIREVDPKLAQAAEMARAWYELRGSAWLLVKDTIEFAVKAGYVCADDSAMSKVQRFANKLKELRDRQLPGGYCIEQNIDESRDSLWRVTHNAGSDS